MSQQWNGYINVSAGKLHYVGIGGGRKLLLCLHGYRNNASLFLPFARYLSQDYTVISLDLPHHGQTNWPGDKPMHPHDLVAVVEELCLRHQTTKLSLVGYSMGGRICLKMVELMPERVERLLLIASDGLAFNPFYYFVTRTHIGKRLFTGFLTNPHRYTRLVDWARNRKLIDASRYKFFMQYLDSHTERMLLLKIWPAMSRLIPDSKRLKLAISGRGIGVYIFMGKHDRIIPVALARKFQRDMPTVQLFELDKGHWLFDAQTMPLMAKCLLP